jgi:hypothetical protein
MTAMAVEGRERAMVAATEVALSLGAITQETSHKPAQNRMDVLAADVHLLGDLSRKVALRGQIEYRYPFAVSRPSHTHRLPSA